MVILVFADSHKDVETMEAVVQKVIPNAVIHLGDHIGDAVRLAEKFPDIRFEMVKGNCDEAPGQPFQSVIRVGSLVLFITHGDLYDVGDGIGEIVRVGLQAGAQVILHGHTHIPSITAVQGVTVMNPGRIGLISSKAIHASFGLIKIDGDGFRCSIFFYDFLAKTSAAYWADTFSIDKH